MSLATPLPSQSANTKKLASKALTGGMIGYVLITLFLLVPGVTTDPDWPRFWTVRPLIMVPLAGAAGGAFYHFLQVLGNKKGWNKILLSIVGLLVFIIGLWMGTILGLDGTLWD